MNQEFIHSLNTQLSKETSLSQKFLFVLDSIDKDTKVVFSTSFGIEDQMITAILNHIDKDIEIFTLDTGRMFNETYDVYQKTLDQYTNLSIKAYTPNQDKLQGYIDDKGINGFYNSIEARKQCCAIRKIEPLQKAIKGAGLWITGLRAEQSTARENLNFVEWDETNQLLKFNPLLHHTLEEVEDYIKQNKVPINSLYYKGYLSIGCAPCTRAIEKGEDFRAGRWWWEQSHKECGLHLK